MKEYGTVKKAMEICIGRDKCGPACSYSQTRNCMRQLMLDLLGHAEAAREELKMLKGGGAEDA